MPYRPTRQPIHRPDGRVEVGEAFEPTDAELRAFADNLEAVDDAQAPPSDAESADESADESEAEAFDAETFVDRTPMGDVIADIESGSYDDRLAAIAEAETAGRDRDGVAEAIAARRDDAGGE